MATLTVPHHRFQSCRELRRAVSAAWRSVKTGKAWVIRKEASGWLGDIRALEITHGGNGWHPHLHVLIFFNVGTSQSEINAFSGWLYDAWAKSVAQQGLGQCSREAYDWEPVEAASGAAQYVGKWGASLELTKAHTKQGKGGRTPWQILSDFTEYGLALDAALFREYADAAKGSHQLTWSRNLRSAYAAALEKSDHDLAEEPAVPETQVATMDRKVFEQVVKRGKTAAVLSALDRGGVNAVAEILTQLRIPWRASKSPGFQRDTFIPLFAWGLSPGQPGESENKAFRAPGMITSTSKPTMEKTL
jgi:hypothetical protein